MYGSGGLTSTSDWGSYYGNAAYANSDVTGPILVRAIDLFRNQPVVFLGRYAAGPVVGTDRVNGRQYQQDLELVFDTSSATKDPTGMYRYAWFFVAGVPAGWSGSTGWQIDGPGFSEVFYVC